jgi:DNA helicase IV
MTDFVDPTLLAERQHLERSRVALGYMRQRTEAITDNAGDELTAYALGRLRRQRLADLADRPDTPLFFGRLHFGDEAAAADAVSHATDEDFHIGRRHVVDASGNPMVLDWRAPLSRTFYQASARKPMNVTIRRRFGFAGGVVTSFEDENLVGGNEFGESSQILAAEIERPRVGPMRDIVATIQPEQDDLVRADLATTICVQGAPGTGKTAVGLHRAAYLLYAFREQLRRSGVLIVGPNTAFMSYIENVLPTLGEVDVTQTAVDELFDAVPVRGKDSPDAARLKHDARMAEVLHRAVWCHVRQPQDSLMVPEGGWRWRIGTEYLRNAVAEAREDGLPYAVGRERVRAQVVSGLRRQSEIRSGDSPSETWGRRIGRSKVVTSFLDEVWPALDPKKLVSRLFTDAEFRAEVCQGLLSDSEQALLAVSTKTVRFSPADAVLVDEVAGLLERPAGFGHIVVDEAQDLSPMQCRAIARRSAHGSITVLGDLAQGTSPWAASDWKQSLRHMGKQTGEVVALTTGFRVPADVIALANQLLSWLDVDVPAARSLRTDGLLELVEADDLDTEVAAAVQRALSFEGSVAVIAPDSHVDRLTAALDVGDRLSVVPASVAKGLEFDHVIVAEPADIVAAEAMGLRRLYVVLTRAVSRLTVVHAKPLPEQLTR